MTETNDKHNIIIKGFNRVNEFIDCVYVTDYHIFYIVSWFSCCINVKLKYLVSKHN